MELIPASRRAPPTFADRVGLAILAAVLGVVAGLLAVAVRRVINVITNAAFYGAYGWSFRSPAEAQDRLGLWIVLVPAVGAVAAVLLVRWTTGAQRVRGTGEVVASSLFSGGRLEGFKTVVHALATLVGLGTGASAGREGAIVQLAAAVGSRGADLLRLTVVNRRTLLAAGAAAAISATFNTPIAGIVFSMEVILLELRARSFGPIAIASVAASVVGRAILGDQPSFPVPVYKLVSVYELPIYLALGLVAGAVTAAFLRSSDWVTDLFAAARLPYWVRPVVGGLWVGALGFAVPRSLGVGYETVRTALNGNLALGVLLTLLFAKVLAYAFTQGSGGATGAFSPSLFVGSMLGGAFGLAAQTALPDLVGPPGAYALVGMAAVYGAAARATLTTLVMLFEMTRTYDIILPIILAVVTADLVTRTFHRESVYTAKFARTGLPTEFEMELSTLDTTRVQDAMTRDVVTIAPQDTIKDVIGTTLRTGHHGFPVIDPDLGLVGIITESDLRTKVGAQELERAVESIMSRDVVVAYPEETLRSALERMLQFRVDHLPVLKTRDVPSLVGLVTRSDVLRTVNQPLGEAAT